MEISGYLYINKPSGISSHGVINRLRRITGITRIGHAGTLDPLASGLLICAVSRQATKTLDSFLKLDKIYEVGARLGGVSDTYDSQGIITMGSVGSIDEESFREKVATFHGIQEQLPPMYSAKQVNGQRLYQMARKGIVIARQPCRIEVKEIRVLDYQWPDFTLLIECSSGTYIRSIVHDLGQRLGVGAYMTSLVRTKIGSVNLRQAIDLDALSQENWQQYLIRD